MRNFFELKITSELLAKKTLLVLFVFFFVCCLKLCAEDVTMTPAQAQVAREKFISEAKQLVGSPYVYGAVGPENFDCSGLIYYTARKSVGIQLPRTAKAMYNYCRIVPESKREIGDLLFFRPSSSSEINHVGIYIGNGQFISAISDGPNSGVIISSLNQDYWKPRYYATGQFLKSGKAYSQEPTENALNNSSSKSEKNENKPKNLEIAKNIVLDSSIFVDWSIFAPNEFMLRFRGIDLQSNMKFASLPLQPGIGLAFRFNTSQNLFQIPLLFSASLNDYFRVYAGPVFSFGNAHLVESDKNIKASVFPGILGLQITTPAINIKSLKLQIVQDISYTVFNNTDNAALNLPESIAAGFVFYTGVKVSLPLSSFIH